MVAPDLRSPGAGQVITAPDPGVIPELAQATPPSRRVVDGKIS
jgi:hypothetical protein